MKATHAFFLTVLLISTVFVIGSCDLSSDTTVTQDPYYVTGLRIVVPAGYPLVPGIDIPLRCMAQFNYSAEQDWTDRVTWSITDPSWASIDANGVFRAWRTTVGEIRVTSNDGWTITDTLRVSTLEAVALYPAQNLLLGGEECAVDVRARLSGGYEVSVSSQVERVWTFTAPNILTVTPDNILHAQFCGQAAVSVSLAGINSFPVVMTVDSILAVSCEELTSAPYLPLDTVKFDAIATTYITGSLPVSDRASWWSSSSLALLHIMNGVFVATAPGQYHAVTSLAGHTGIAGVEIWNVLSLDISPTEVADTLDRNDTLQFTTTAVVEGHGSQDLTSRATWISTNSDCGIFATPGMFIANRTGQTQVYAQIGFVMSPRTTINVFAPALINDGFESYALGTFTSNVIWDVWTGEDDETKVEIWNVAATGVKGCALIDSVYDYTAGIESQAGYIGDLYSGSVEADLRPGPGLWMWVGGPSSSYLAAMVMFRYGDVYLNFYDVVGDYTPDEWYHVRFDFDCETDRFDFYLNGEQLVSDEYFYYSQDYIDQVSAYTSPADEDGIAHVDNFWVDGYEEQNPMSSRRERTPRPGDFTNAARFR